MPISAFLITLNEEDKIACTLDSLKWTDEQIVVDGGSSDRTAEICRQKGAKVFHRPFDNFESQKNYALSLTQHDWVLSIDADELVSESLQKEILRAIANPIPLVGYDIRRTNYFLGKPLQFGGQRREAVLRLFRKDGAKFSGIVHEKVCVQGPVGELGNVLEHKGTETLKDYFPKLKLYTDLEAKRMVAENRVPSLFRAIVHPPAKWGLNYVLLAGFLDGWHGSLYHALSCYYGWMKNFKARAIRKETRKF